MDYRIFPPDDLLQARVRLPLSKSISNRLLIINSLTAGAPAVGAVAECDDTRVMMAALASGDDEHIDVEGAGTAMRFLTAYYAAMPGVVKHITGNDRMRQRPIGTLVDALRQLGADIEYEGEEGFPPLRIAGRALEGGAIEIDGQVSSQFTSALAMIAPTMQRGLSLHFTSEAVSLPYVKMTLALMSRYGIDCEYYDYTVTVNPGPYRAPAEPVEVEGDWSAAAFWYEIEALTSGFITLDGLAHPSIQGDAYAAELFASLGVVTEYEGEDGGIDLMGSPDPSPRLICDLSDYPDMLPAVAVTCAMIGIPFKISGLASLRIKETDRLAAVTRELEKIGILAEVTDNTMSWELQRRPITQMPEFDTYGDHRMAMALAPVSLFIPGIVVKDIEVVSKSYPEYWDHLRDAGFTLRDASEPLDEMPAEEADAGDEE